MTEPHVTDTQAGRYVLDVISTAGKPITITDIAARLFADPLRVTPVVIKLYEAGALSKHTVSPRETINVVTYGIPGRDTEPQPDSVIARAHVNGERTGRPSPYPTKGRQELGAQNRSEGAGTT